MGGPKTKTAWGVIKPKSSKQRERLKSAGVEKRNVFSHLPTQSDLTALELIRVQCYMSGYKLHSKTVGSGAYAKVYLAEVTSEKTVLGPDMTDVSLKQTNPMVAVKVIDKNIIPSSFLRKFIPRELENHRSLPPHANVVRCFEHFSSGDHVFVVMEYCEKGDLLQFINDTVRQDKVLSHDLIRTIFKQICLGLQHMHSEGIVHRDLKCENILLANDLSVKITDLGFSCRVEDKNAILKTSCGSYTYAAPEVIASKLYNGFKADIWSLGVILFAMANGRLPFTERLVTDMNEQMRQQVLLFEDYVSSDCSILIQRILQYDPDKRPTVAQILSDRWLHEKTRKNGNGRMINRPKWVNSYTIEKEDPASALSQLRIGNCSAPYLKEKPRPPPKARTPPSPPKKATKSKQSSTETRPAITPGSHTTDHQRKAKSSQIVKPLMANFLPVTEECSRITQTKASLTVTADPQCFRYVPKWFFQRMLQANDKLKTYYSKPKCRWVSSDSCGNVKNEKRPKTTRTSQRSHDLEPSAPRSTPEPKLLPDMCDDRGIKPLRKNPPQGGRAHRVPVTECKNSTRAKSCMARLIDPSARSPVLLVKSLARPRITEGSELYTSSSAPSSPTHPPTARGGHLHTRSSQLRCQLAKAKIARYSVKRELKLQSTMCANAWEGDVGL